MTGRDAAQGWWVGVVLGSAILLPLVYSCTADERLAPPSPFGTLRGDGQAGNPFGPPFQVPVPATNDQGISPVTTGIVIPPGVVATVTVTGFLHYTVNGAAVAACPPPLPSPISPGDLSVVGPAGFLPVNDPRFNGGYRGGEVEVYESTDNNPPPYGIRLQFQPQDATAGTVTATVTGLPPLGRLWVVRPPSFPSSCGVNAGTPNPTSIPGFLVSGSQTLSADLASGGGGGGGCAMPPCPPPPVTIVGTVHGSGSVSATNPNGSFTAKGETLTPAENVLKLHATVSPPELAPRVTWQVKPDPQHFPIPVLQPPPTSGTDAVFTVLPLGPIRWPMDHLTSLALAPKQLSFVFTASVQDDEGQTHTSSPVTATQDGIDTIREEYIEFGRGDPVAQDFPTRDDFGARADPAGHFGPDDLNSGDYRDPHLYWAQDDMLDGLDGMWDLQAQLYATDHLPFNGFRISGGFRNPVHHVFHLPGGLDWSNSAHQYGLAADIRISDQPMPPATFFVVVEILARDIGVNACFEPAAVIIKAAKTLDHAHVDWMNACGSNW